MRALDHVKAAAARLTDTLATMGERMPALSQVTASVAGVTVTVTPKAPPPPEPPRCPSCGRSG